MTSVRTVLVVGGGTAGCSVAALLARAGVTVEIVERKPDSTVHGSGITLQGAAHRVLREVGVYDELHRHGYEFAALGPEWHVQEWGDQWEAFDAVLSHLSQFDFSFYLRVHPNFATKSHASFFREKAHIEKLQGRHPALKVIWHDEQVNSYTLLNQTDVVVVWDSTIGLEASGRGLPVWELAASYFDLYADVREWFGPAIKPSREEIEFAVDTDRAHRFMAYLELREPQLSKEAVDVRATLFPKVGVGLRIANVVSTGGAPTIMIGLASILDAMRHRRFAINRIAVRKALSR